MIGASILAPTAAMADQKSKNDWRNLGTGAAAVGAYGLLNGDKTLGVIGLAGAGYSAYRYEQDRKHQSQENAARQRSYYRSSARKYYYYQGHRYYQNLNTGERVCIY
jgi:hypothetical protein